MKVKQKGGFWEEVAFLQRQYEKLEHHASTKEVEQGYHMLAFRDEVKSDIRARFTKDDGSPKVLKIIFNVIEFAAKVFVLIWPELVTGKR